ncbi:MAG TPA: TrkA family potassium uptake protein [Candidatus Limnocylindrales bacterium]|nr:TrkA family potassium uptake protein [Candidatus Limnocylindrales bacterium]
MKIKSELVLPSGTRRRVRYRRILRAFWRDNRAIWREFRRPLIIFFIAIVGGGLLFGELYFLALGVRLQWTALPYMMLSLMSLQGIPEQPVPSEWYLLLFYYLMPAVAVYVIGRGAIDFVRIFFNRGERRRAWEEAVASTYRNHVIVLGIGHVGMRVVRTLAGMHFDVVAIDWKITPQKEAELSQLGVPVITADGRDKNTLELAGLPVADALVVCTANDQLNLEVTLRARDLNPQVRIVVRAWDTQFADQLQRLLGVNAVLSSSDLSAPAFAGAAVGIEVAQSFEMHGTRFSMIRLVVAAGSRMAGKTIGDLQAGEHVDIVLHERNGDANVNPPHDVVIQAGDGLVLFAHHDHIVDVAMDNRGQNRA